MNDPDSGYAHLRAALDEAHARPGSRNMVAVTRFGHGTNKWFLATGDHVGSDGTLHLGYGLRIAEDSTIVGSHGGRIGWRGGHTMPDGERVERFNLDGVAMTVSWRKMAKAA